LVAQKLVIGPAQMIEGVFAAKSNAEQQDQASEHRRSRNAR